MTLTNQQKQKLLKAKIALAMRDEFGTIPEEEAVEYTYHFVRVVFKAVLGTHYLRKQQKKQGQLALF